MEELNKKLAEWAGFFKVTTDMLLTMSFEELKRQGLHYPNGEPCCYLPNFTDSLDACFKWLVPKLQENYNIDGVPLFVRWEIHRESLLQRSRVPHGWEAEIWFRDRENIEEIWAETPALALCKAIEKLIDSKEVD